MQDFRVQVQEKVRPKLCLQNWLQAESQGLHQKAHEPWHLDQKELEKRCRNSQKMVMTRACLENPNNS